MVSNVTNIKIEYSNISHVFLSANQLVVEEGEFMPDCLWQDYLFNLTNTEWEQTRSQETNREGEEEEDPGWPQKASQCWPPEWG